jgi:hypothetical protein
MLFILIYKYKHMFVKLKHCSVFERVTEILFKRNKCLGDITLINTDIH